MDIIAVCIWVCLNVAVTVADCPPPTEQNAAFTPVQSSYADGSTVTFTCNAGYELDGQRIHTCRGSSWKGSLTCQEQFCETIINPKNGKIVGNPSYKIGTFVTFECNKGYTLKGRSQLLCRVDLKFDGDPPTCNVVMCPDFGIIDHAHIFQATDGGIENDYGSVVKITCEDTYELDGSASVYCQEKGTWGPKPSCKPVHCGSFNGMNSSCVDNFILFDALYYMKCKTDVPSTRIGPENKNAPNECQESRTWMYTEFGCFCHCKVMYNKYTVKTENLETNDYLPHDRVLKWSCTEGCMKNSTVPLKCNDGKMEMPTCTCTDPTESPVIFQGTTENGTMEHTTKSHSPKESTVNSEYNVGHTTDKPGPKIQPCMITIIAVVITLVVCFTLLCTIMLYKKKKLCFTPGTEFENAEGHHREVKQENSCQLASETNSKSEGMGMNEQNKYETLIDFDEPTECHAYGEIKEVKYEHSRILLSEANTKPEGTDMNDQTNYETLIDRGEATECPANELINAYVEVTAIMLSNKQ